MKKEILSRDMMRRYAAEFCGTFALVFFGCGTRAMVGDTSNFAGILMVHIAFGFTIAAMIYTFSHLSSAHFNPAITVGFAIARRFPWRFVVPYWVAQFAGAVLASTFHFLIFPDRAAAAHYGATIPKIPIVPSLAVEIILTFFLMLVSMSTATDKRFNRADGGLTVGFTIVISGLIANSLTGGSMNPARSLAPALFAAGDALASYWIYLVAPLCGAILGALIYEVMRGSEEYAKPALDELPVKKVEKLEQLKLPA
ncbi:MAG: aquaporin family protein [Chloroflexi bacterium]|nr:aquaporin family protein [Chloroflexota bacterium]